MDKTQNIARSNGTCRCQQLSTVDSDNTQTQWYKEMYGQIHKSPETKKDEQQNPYKPTYTFPEELDGDLKRMEDYIRKAASQTIDDGDRKTENRRNIPSSITNIQDRQTIPKRTHLDDQMTSSSTERTKSNNDPSVSSSITISPRSNPVPIRTPSSTTDDEQKSVYKRILRGGDIPSSGLQKISGNNRDLRWHVDSPSGFNKNRFKPTIKSSLFSDNELSQKSNDRELLELDQQKPQSRINETQPISKAYALHNFYAQTNRELSFKKGDTILVKRRINDDWLEGEYQGKTGIFPVNHVELFPDETTEGEAIVKHDFLPQKTYELQLRKGEKVILLRKLENDWYEGRLNHNEGIFPAEYVEVLREPKVEQSNQNEQVTKIPKSVLKNSTGLQQTSVEKTNVVPQLSLPMQKCQVLYDYTPQNPDELEIHVGDILSIIEMCDDGWYCGIMEKSPHDNRMTFGTFPGNYVKILPI